MKERLKAPELRFDGFTDDWEERKLNEVSDIYDGTHQTPKYQDDGVMFLSVENIKTLTSNKFISREAFEDEFKIRPQRGDVLMTRIGDIGTANVVETDEDLAYYVSLALFKSEELNPYFLQASIYAPFVQDQIWKRTLHIAFPKKINKNEIGQVPINVPTLEEQTKIGSFFKQLDDTITLHQRKLDLLKEQKKGYLQKMFPKAGEKIPELRFAGFADDWEDRKLSSIAERVTRKNKNNESTLPLTISAQDGLVDQNDYFNKQVASRDVTGYFLVKNGEFAYNKSYSNGYPWGAIKRLDKYEMGVLSTLYIVFKPTAINSQFLVSYYETTRWYREVSKNAAEGARNHGLLNISPNDFFNTLLTIPKSAEEQQQIGSFFKQLDDTIALHQRKLDLLKEQKKGFLQKMFV
ncbi:restriction endonuclease subunit S [Lactococcus lactis]|uniref:restriction endonuclease subunit S n=1 Tax=Lactococcus lactis TaxID=1358 RepID=UPI00288FB7E7|nr:restriction endonuclease subunit S [Lactococcus lactis]MDT2874133.1 restriction endonuclease subunit S [Lactococcus lactis]